MRKEDTYNSLAHHLACLGAFCTDLWSKDHVCQRVFLWWQTWINKQRLRLRSLNSQLLVSWKTIRHHWDEGACLPQKTSQHTNQTVIWMDNYLVPFPQMSAWSEGASCCLQQLWDELWPWERGKIHRKQLIFRCSIWLLQAGGRSSFNSALIDFCWQYTHAVACVFM